MIKYFQNCSKRRFLVITAYLMEFGLFLILFCLTPAVCDRWMEKGVQAGFETFVNYLAYQYTWFWGANGRIFSNIYSYLVDWNVLVRALVNAGALVLISYIVNECVGKEESDKNPRRTLIACMLPFLISSEIYIEVYFYATTLYISTALIFSVLFYFFEKKLYRFLNKKGKVLSGIVVFVCSMWLENLSLCIVAYLFVFAVRNYISHRKISRYITYNLTVSLAGLLFMLFSSRFASMGRLTQDRGISLASINDTVFGFLDSNAVVLLLFGISMLLFVKCHSVHRIEKMVICSWWGG